MASDERETAGALTRVSALAEHPEKFHIFQALRLIEAAYADSPRLGRSKRPKQDPVRLKQRVDMAFAPSTITQFKPRAAKGGAPGTVQQLMFGMFGPNGPMPLHLTEYARNRLHSHRDPTLSAFADVFHHRMLSLLYRAYASASPAAIIPAPAARPPWTARWSMRSASSVISSASRPPPARKSGRRISKECFHTCPVSFGSKGKYGYLLEATRL